MKETLTCTQCEKRWRRERSRGRKPHLCPKCTKAAANIQPKKKAVVEVAEVSKKKKFRKVEPKRIEVKASNQKDDSPQELSVGKVLSYYHPTDEKLREQTKGGSQWKCRCGYIFETKFSLTAVPTHKCTENGKSIPMTRTDK